MFRAMARIRTNPARLTARVTRRSTRCLSTMRRQLMACVAAALVAEDIEIVVTTDGADVDSGADAPIADAPITDAGSHCR